MSVEDPSFAPVSRALSALYSNTDRHTKQEAGQLLEQFQKSPEAWSTTHSILVSHALPLETKLFAAQTLRSKVIYDMNQLSDESKLQLRSSLLDLLVAYKAGPKIIVTQLCLALANLAIQLLSWHNAVQEILTVCGNDASSAPIILEFLKVLPEEATDVRKISLSEEELRTRTVELLQDNASFVMNLLIAYVESASTPKSSHALIFECLNSWLREVPLQMVINSALLNLVFQALASDDLFDSATDCVCSMIRETRDVDETLPSISILYAKIMQLRPRIAASKDLPEDFKNYTRIFAEAGEAWHMLIARMPKDFRGLVEAIAECAAYDDDLEVVQYTFYFWYLLKQMLVLDRYDTAKRELHDVYLSLIDIIIAHLHYPYDERNGDLFGNDKEAEEKFRAFRHEMGDVLKDCCAVVGASNALRKAYAKVDECYQTQQAGENVAWQNFEAPVFSMRAMAREVDLDETHVMPQIMDLLVRLPKHKKILFAVILVLGRYTEWTAKHPEYLQIQLQYITGGFSENDSEIAGAAAQSMMHFCRDCNSQLASYFGQIKGFYEQVAQKISLDSLYDLTDGVAHLVAAQAIENIYASLKSVCDPIVERIYVKANGPVDDSSNKKIADEMDLLDTFARLVHPPILNGAINPCIQYWMETWPLVDLLLSSRGQSTAISERVCKFLRTLMCSYRNDFYSMLGMVAEKLVAGFEKYHYGCFLWASGIAVREYGNEYSDKNIQEAVWEFAYRQCITTFTYMSSVNLGDIPDVLEDLFRLLSNLVSNYPYKFIPSELCKPSIEAAVAIFGTEQKEPIFTAIDLLHDILSYGFSTPPTSRISFNESGDRYYDAEVVPAEVQSFIRGIVLSEGMNLTKQLFFGLLYTLPRECVSDAAGILLVIFRLGELPASAQWVQATLDMLPAEAITAQEKFKYVSAVESALQGEDMNRLRRQTMDLVGWYTRRNVTPRSDIKRIGDIRDQKVGYA
ncbi:armadillo-type protein [Limtongia smithiae]|uniref:armadillo-type protein n=1 Tax=Limtongia smithiae TaxID=1125753 RepID=UPI0034CDBFA5